MTQRHEELRARTQAITDTSVLESIDVKDLANVEGGGKLVTAERPAQEIRDGVYKVTTADGQTLVAHIGNIGTLYRNIEGSLQREIWSFGEARMVRSPFVHLHTEKVLVEEFIEGPTLIEKLRDIHKSHGAHKIQGDSYAGSALERDIARVCHEVMRQIVRFLRHVNVENQMQFAHNDLHLENIILEPIDDSFRVVLTDLRHSTLANSKHDKYNYSDYCTLINSKHNTYNYNPTTDMIRFVTSVLLFVWHEVCDTKPSDVRGVQPFGLEFARSIEWMRTTQPELPHMVAEDFLSATRRDRMLILVYVYTARYFCLHMSPLEWDTWEAGQRATAIRNRKRKRNDFTQEIYSRALYTAYTYIWDGFINNFMRGLTINVRALRDQEKLQALCKALATFGSPLDRYLTLQHEDDLVDGPHTKQRFESNSNDADEGGRGGGFTKIKKIKPYPGGSTYEEYLRSRCGEDELTSSFLKFFADVVDDTGDARDRFSALVKNLSLALLELFETTNTGLVSGKFFRSIPVRCSDVSIENMQKHFVSCTDDRQIATNYHSGLEANCVLHLDLQDVPVLPVYDKSPFYERETVLPPGMTYDRVRASSPLRYRVRARSPLRNQRNVIIRRAPLFKPLTRLTELPDAPPPLPAPAPPHPHAASQAAHAPSPPPAPSAQTPHAASPPALHAPPPLPAPAPPHPHAASQAPHAPSPPPAPSAQTPHAASLPAPADGPFIIVLKEGSRQWKYPGGSGSTLRRVAKIEFPHAVSSPVGPMWSTDSVLTFGAHLSSNDILMRLRVPEGVQAIGASALAMAPLYSNELSLPTTLTSIEEQAFSSAKLTTLHLYHTRLVSIGRAAFLDAKLTSLTLPATLEIIGIDAFRNAALTSLTLFHTQLRQIQSSAFKHAKLTSLTLPATLEMIHVDAFEHAALTSLTLSHTQLRHIYSGAFRYAKLTSLTLPATLKGISATTFRSAKLTTLDLSHLHGDIAINFSKSAMFESLTEIFLDNCDLNMEALAALSRAIKKGSNLQYLTLTANYLDVKGAKVLAPAIVHLKEIGLAHNNFGPRGAEELIVGSAFSGNLESISLDGNNLGWEGAEVLVKGGAFKGSLTSIGLSNNKLCGVDEDGQGTYTTDGITAIAGALFKGFLTSIDLGFNALGVEGAKALVEGGAFRGSLTEIDLSLNGLNAKAAEILAPAIHVSDSLTSIDLYDNELGPKGAQALVEGGAFRGSLTSINLAANGLGSEGAQALVEGGAFRGSLTSIDLRTNNLGNEGAKALVEGGAFRGSLTSINLQLNNLNAEGAKALADGGAFRGSLTSINLRCNNLGSEGAEALVKGGAFRGSLTSVNLFDNNLGPEGAKALVEGGAFRGSLTSIDLSFNNLRAEGAKALAAGGAFRGSLTKIGLSMNRLDAAAAETLAPVIRSGTLAEIDLTLNNFSTVTVHMLQNMPTSSSVKL